MAIVQSLGKWFMVHICPHAVWFYPFTQCSRSVAKFHPPLSVWYDLVRLEFDGLYSRWRYWRLGVEGLIIGWFRVLFWLDTMVFICTNEPLFRGSEIQWNPFFSRSNRFREHHLFFSEISDSGQDWSQDTGVSQHTRPGKHTKSYWKWPFIVDFPIKHCDFL